MSGGEYTSRPMTLAEWVDITHWYGYIKAERAGICPHCGTVLTELPREANLVPHFMMACGLEGR